VTATQGESPSPDIGAAGFEAGRTLHFPCFDAFRFFGMTMVLLVHAAFATRPWVETHLPEWLQSLLQRMDVGVAVFFVLSGFLLFRPFVVRQLAGRPPMKTGTFLRRRSLRVLPGYWFALTFCVVVLGQLLGSVKNAFLYYSLLFPFATQDVALGGGPGQEGKYAIPQAWSLTAEFVFYLMLPVIAYLLVRLAARRSVTVQMRTMLLIAGGLYLFGQLFRAYFLVAQPSWERVAVIWAPNWIDFFAIGMALAVFSGAEQFSVRPPALLRALGDHPAVSWSIATLVGLSFATFSPPSTPGVFGAEYWVRWFLFGVFSFFLLAPAMFGDQTAGRGRRFLASRPLVLLGTVSLGFYLFHLAFLGQAQEWLGVGDFGGSLPTVFAITFVCSVGMAFVSYYVVERPFLGLKDRSFRSLWRREPPPPPSPGSGGSAVAGASVTTAVASVPAPEPDRARAADNRTATTSRALTWAAVGSVVAVAALGAFFVVRGRLNADEGWYLYSSRLVYRGQLPFRDFSFTQMPLLPYLYGLVQLVKPSLYLGRLVSLVLLTGAVAMSVRVAWREAGRAAAVAVGLLVLLAPTAVYNLTLTKTYALVAFFLAALLLTLTSPGRRTLMFPLAAAAAVGLALSRSSGLPLAAIVLVYLLWRAPDRRTRGWVAGISAVGALAVAGFVLVDVHAARFDLSTFHQLLWHGADTGTRLDTIVTTRIPDWFGEYWGYVLLVGGAVVAIVTSAEVRQYVKRQPAYLILTVGTVIYLGSQLTPGQFAPVEYAAAVIPLVITIPVILISRRLLGPDGTVPAFRGAALAGVAVVVVLGVVTVVHPGVGEFVVHRDSPESIAAANRVAAFVRDHTKPSDEVLALWGQPATLASGRDLVPSATFGLFSYEDLSDDEARALHYVNQDRLVRLIESGRPAMIVLTDVDRTFFNFPGSLSNKRADPRRVERAIAANYTKITTDVGLGVNGPTNVDVYVRNDRA